MGKKTLYFDSFCGMDSCAAVEDGKLTDFNYESAQRQNIIGNIYKGRVTDVLNGMQAAFVNCGLERNCYLSAEDILPDKNKYDGGEVDIPAELDLHVGDEVLVQVVKPPIGKKGAKVTTALSFVGKYTIFMPATPFIGVSRKIHDSELRKSLIFAGKRICRGSEGWIIRTAAPYANRRQATDEVNYYRRIYSGCVRAIDFIVSLPEYDGENLGVVGASQGGALSIVTAALDSRVKALVAFHPALCDVTGYLHGRAGGWPHMFAPKNASLNNKPEKIETSRYYDVVNFARLLKVPGYYSWGYNDPTCPPTSYYAAYNVITAPKQLYVAHITGHWRLPEQNEVTFGWLYDMLTSKK